MPDIKISADSVGEIVSNGTSTRRRSIPGSRITNLLASFSVPIMAIVNFYDCDSQRPSERH